MPVRVLGRVEVELDGAKHRAVLAELALREHGATVAQLVDALWGEDPPATAAKMLQGYVAAIRARSAPG